MSREVIKAITPAIGAIQKTDGEVMGATEIVWSDCIIKTKTVVNIAVYLWFSETPKGSLSLISNKEGSKTQLSLILVAVRRNLQRKWMEEIYKSWVIDEGKSDS